MTNATMVLFGLSLFLAVVLAEGFFIRYLRTNNLNQRIKLYGPQRHLCDKRETPTMGGIVFVIAALFVALGTLKVYAFPFWEWGLFWYFPLCSSLVGLLDDLLKHLRDSSEGLRSMQKLVLQLAVTVPWAVMVIAVTEHGVFSGGLPADLLSIAVVSFVACGLLNAVNITDGLDGLVAGSGIISFAFLLIVVRGSLCCTVGALTGLALLAAFLWHNALPARVFMGDVGAHFIGGLLASIAVFSGDFRIVVPAGFLFGIEVATVSMQLFAIHKLNRKIFRMSPLHHHFELLGWSEQQIVTRFWIVHALGIVTIAVFLIEA
ncbi:MAG: phospho-N-acetylmuramoyl-pentapeptide-transferase [Synergistales bacterium]|nr:phospho-N-acetylmuramoyl-pentapeptide-transferase [Synergistales bacterium]